MRVQSDRPMPLCYRTASGSDRILDQFASPADYSLSSRLCDRVGSNRGLNQFVFYAGFSVFK